MYACVYVCACVYMHMGTYVCVLASAKKSLSNKSSLSDAFPNPFPAASDLTVPEAARFDLCFDGIWRTAFGIAVTLGRVGVMRRFLCGKNYRGREICKIFIVLI